MSEAKVKKPARKVRSAVTGRYVDPAAAKVNPRETVVETDEAARLRKAILRAVRILRDALG